MAEFQEVCKHLKRMCGRYGDNCIKCPLENKDFCSLSAGDRTAETYKKAEEIIMSWAAEHPEPVYPTWYEYLISERVLVPRSNYTTYDLNALLLAQLKNTPIPADIAQKLEIAQKEG